MPQWQPALEQAWRLLPRGGRLIVLDFLDTPYRFVRRRMDRYGVELGEERRDWLREQGQMIRDQQARASLGLWSYYLTITER